LANAALRRLMTAVPVPEIEPFVDADRAAEFLVITRRHLLEMARAGEIPAHPIGSGKRKTWRFRLSEIADAISTEDSYEHTVKTGYYRRRQSP
jgi:excisionase family DNA binding protein